MDAPYRDASLATDERVADLLARMSVGEKLAQLGGVWSLALLDGDRFSESKARDMLADGTGHVSRISAQTTLGPRESARLANDIQRFLVENTRLGIPAIVHEESCAGFTARGATQFPQAIGLASTWEPALVSAMAMVIRSQIRAVGARQTLAPVLDIARDPRLGRCEETFGEDPYLAARMGVAYVRGVQGESLRDGVVATGKHFVGYGASEAGLNWAPAQLPLYYNHKPSGARSQFWGDHADLPVKPAFPFGHGLGYTDFEYANLSLSSERPNADDTLEICFDLTNVGDRDGEEVTQLYVCDRVGSVTRPVKELKGFARIPLARGEKRRVRFRLDLRQLAFYARDMRPIVEPGQLSIWLGSSSEDLRLTAEITTNGGVRLVSLGDVRPTAVDVF